MSTPICDFVRRYAGGGAVRLHMPGHKGCGPLGCEALDITEKVGKTVTAISGATVSTKGVTKGANAALAAVAALG